MTVVIIDKSHITDAFLNRIIPLVYSIWPPKNGPVDLEKEILAWRARFSTEFEKSICLIDNNDLVGYARIFKRDIIIDKTPRKNLALASVCVKETSRGKGYGKELLRSSLAFVNEQQFECAIFQTKVPEFYEKFGAKRIANKIINGIDKVENPFWDPHVMIYPGNFSIAGFAVIDLQGKGY